MNWSSQCTLNLIYPSLSTDVETIYFFSRRSAERVKSESEPPTAECRFLSRVEGRGSRVKCRVSRVKCRVSRVKCRRSRVKCRGSRVKCRGSKNVCGSQFSRLFRVDRKTRMSVRAFPLFSAFRTFSFFTWACDGELLEGPLRAFLFLSAPFFFNLPFMEKNLVPCSLTNA